MIIKNLTGITRTYVLHGNEITVPPYGESSDLILSVEDVRIIYSTGKGKIQFKVTNPVNESRILAEVGAEIEVLVNEELELEEIKPEPVKKRKRKRSPNKSVDKQIDEEK